MQNPVAILGSNVFRKVSFVSRFLLENIVAKGGKSLKWAFFGLKRGEKVANSL